MRDLYEWMYNAFIGKTAKGNLRIFNSMKMIASDAKSTK